MTRPVGQLERSLAALTIGMAQGQAARAKGLADTGTGEYLQQVHVPVSGVAGADALFADTNVQWELPFLYAPDQRRVPFLTPHFTYGIEITAGQAALVVVDAHVVGWAITEQNWYVGATVRLSASSPGAVEPVPYSAIAHLSFEGYATPAEGDEFTK